MITDVNRDQGGILPAKGVYAMPAEFENSRITKFAALLTKRKCCRQNWEILPASREREAKTALSYAVFKFYRHRVNGVSPYADLKSLSLCSKMLLLFETSLNFKCKANIQKRFCHVDQGKRTKIFSLT